MSEKYKFYDPDGIYFVTLTVVFWIDLFTRVEYKNMIVEALKYKVWQDGNHPVLLDTNKMMDQRLDYIHQNPIESGIVEDAEHYLFSSARDYAGVKGLLEVDFIE